jgi:hypothetical protein
MTLYVSRIKYIYSTAIKVENHLLVSSILTAPGQKTEQTIYSTTTWPGLAQDKKWGLGTDHS